MATKYLAKVANGTYTDKKTGKEKTSWLTIGKVIQKDDGSLSLKLDSIPVAFSGWINFFDPPSENERQQQSHRLDDEAPF